MTDIPPPFDAVWFQTVLGLLIGLALGSFVTMLSYRLPRKWSLTEPSRSFCPSCNTPLKTRDLIPLVSWAAAGGKCRYCGINVSARYPLIELVTAALTAAAFVLIGFRPALIVSILLIVLIVTIATIKIEKSK